MRAAITQHAIVVGMLNALIKADNDLINICDIVWVEQCGGKQFHTSHGQAHPSVAKKTLWRYGNNAPRGNQDVGGSGQNQFLDVASLTLGQSLLMANTSSYAQMPTSLGLWKRSSSIFRGTNCVERRMLQDHHLVGSHPKAIAIGKCFVIEFLASLLINA